MNLLLIQLHYSSEHFTTQKLLVVLDNYHA